MTALVINSVSESEEWRDVPGFAGIYQTSNKGRVRSIDRQGETCYGATRNLTGKVVAKTGGKREYLRVSTRKYGVMFVHRLVALTWIPNPLSLPVINHIDGDKQNNHPSNLEWCTQAHNVTHAIKTGLTKKAHLKKGDLSISAKLTEKKVAEIKKRLIDGERSVDLAREFGVVKGTIGEIKAGRSWGHVNAANS